MLAIYPYTRCETTYINTIQSMLETKYTVVAYNDVKKGVIPLSSINTIYLNWIENVIDETDKSFLNEAKKSNIKIIWVFHNKLPHDSTRNNKDKKNISFLINTSDVVAILSYKSLDYLKEYVPKLDTKKVKYLGHQDFCQLNGNLIDPRLENVDLNSEMLFSCIGLIRPYKNIEILIEAFKRFNINKHCKLLIAGKPIDFQYVEELKKLADDESIVFMPEYIPASMMGYYVEVSDILVSPYSIDSSMNSGVMVLAFSNKKTVITADIAMVGDYSTSKMYKYTYKNEKEHIKALYEQIEKAYHDGKEVLKRNGNCLYNELLLKNSKEAVQNRLFEIINNDKNYIKKEDEVEIGILSVIEERELWRERYKISQMFERLAKAKILVSDILLKNNIRRVAIYGYGVYGKRLVTEFQTNGIEIAYVIDKNKEKMKTNFSVYTFDEALPEEEHLIIAAPGVNYHKVREKFNKQSKINVYILKEFF